MQRELKLRIVSGVILAAIVLAATWYGGLAFRILAVVIGLLIYYEWSKMTGIARDWVANAVGWIGEAAIAFLVLVGNFEFAAGMAACCSSRRSSSAPGQPSGFSRHRIFLSLHHCSACWR